MSAAAEAAALRQPRTAIPCAMISVMAQWLVKEEPEHYSYDQLEKDKKTVWAGVRNPLAQKHLRGIKRGDRIFYYHTGKEKAVVATAKAASDAYPDPNDTSGKLSVVDIVPDKKLPRAVTLAEIKSDKAFASFPLVRMSRLSVMPVTDAEWDADREAQSIVTVRDVRIVHAVGASFSSSCCRPSARGRAGRTAATS